MPRNASDFRTGYKDPQRDDFELESAEKASHIGRAQDLLTAFEKLDAGTDDRTTGGQAHAAMEAALTAVLEVIGQPYQTNRDIRTLLHMVQVRNDRFATFGTSVDPNIYTAYVRYAPDQPRMEPGLTELINWQEKTRLDAQILIDHARDLHRAKYSYE